MFVWRSLHERYYCHVRKAKPRKLTVEHNEISTERSRHLSLSRLINLRSGKQISLYCNLIAAAQQLEMEWKVKLWSYRVDYELPGKTEC